MTMQKVSSMVSANLGDTLSNIKNWGGLFYNAGNYGVVPSGKDVTNKLQELVNLANSEGRTTIVFPAGDYTVTSIVNDGNIVYFGDGARFVGGYNKTINSFVDFLSISEQLEETVTGVYNVKTRFGARGNGVDDDSAAFNAAIASCPTGGTVYIPTPTSYYRCSQPIDVTKPISIIGPGAKYPFTIGSEMIQFDSNCKYGFHVRSNDVRIENLSLLIKSTTSDTVGGIFLDTLDADMDGFIRNIHISDVDVMMTSNFGHGVRGISVITSTFTNVVCQQGAFGFYFDNIGVRNGTSIKFDSCWALNNCSGGYALIKYYYCSFINTSADTVNGALYAYVLSDCKSISFNGCASEKFVQTNLSISSCDGIVINACLTHLVSTPIFATFAEIRSSSKNITFIGCEDLSTSTFSCVTIDGTSENPVVINCNFPNGFSNDGSIRPVPANKGYALVGTTLITNDGIAPGNLGTLPTASSDYRGRIVRVEGSAGFPDTLYVCLKSSTNTYSWKTITTG